MYDGPLLGGLNEGAEKDGHRVIPSGRQDLTPNSDAARLRLDVAWGQLERANLTKSSSVLGWNS